MWALSHKLHPRCGLDRHQAIHDELMHFFGAGLTWLASYMLRLSILELVEFGKFYSSLFLTRPLLYKDAQSCKKSFIWRSLWLVLEIFSLDCFASPPYKILMMRTRSTLHTAHQLSFNATLEFDFSWNIVSSFYMFVCARQAKGKTYELVMVTVDKTQPKQDFLAGGEIPLLS